MWQREEIWALKALRVIPSTVLASGRGRTCCNTPEQKRARGDTWTGKWFARGCRGKHAVTNQRKEPLSLFQYLSVTCFGLIMLSGCEPCTQSVGHVHTCLLPAGCSLPTRVSFWIVLFLLLLIQSSHLGRDLSSDKPPLSAYGEKKNTSGKAHLGLFLLK